MIVPFLPLFPVHSLYLCSHPPHIPIIISVSLLYPHSRLLLLSLFPVHISSYLLSLPTWDLCEVFVVVSLFPICAAVSLIIHSFITYSCFPLFPFAGQFWDASLEEEVVRLGWFLFVLLQRWVHNVKRTCGVKWLKFQVGMWRVLEFPSISKTVLADKDCEMWLKAQNKAS